MHDFDGEGEGGSAPVFRAASPGKRRKADLFFADLVGIRAPRRQALTPHRESESESLAEDAGEATWGTVALPLSRTPPTSLRVGDLIVQRVLGDAQLARIRVLGNDIHTRDLYGPDGLLRADVLVIRPQTISQLRAQPAQDTEEALGHSEASADETVNVAPAVTIEAAQGLGTARTTAPIATISPQRQMNELLDRELILIAKARVLATWADQKLSFTFEQARADAALMARLDCSKDKALLRKLPFPSSLLPERRKQLFTPEAVLKELLKAPTTVEGLWPIIDVLRYYGVVLTPSPPANPLGPQSVMASISRVEARLERQRFDTQTAALEQFASKFKADVADGEKRRPLHHVVESERIPQEWSAGKKSDPPLLVARPLVALLRRIHAINPRWLAGTYPRHFWNDFSLDIFVKASRNAEGFWARDAVRDFFRALNTACEQDTAPGKFAWKGIYNDAELATEMNGLYGAGRVLSGVKGHGPGPDMHIHLDVRPLTVLFDAKTGFWLEGPRVVMSPSSAGATLPPLSPTLAVPTPT